MLTEEPTELVATSPVTTERSDFSNKKFEFIDFYMIQIATLCQIFALRDLESLDLYQLNQKLASSLASRIYLARER